MAGLDARLYYRLDQIIAIIGVFDGATLGLTTPDTRYRAVFGAQTHPAARHMLGTIGFTTV